MVSIEPSKHLVEPLRNIAQMVFTRLLLVVLLQLWTNCEKFWGYFWGVTWVCLKIEYPWSPGSVLIIFTIQVGYFGACPILGPTQISSLCLPNNLCLASGDLILLESTDPFAEPLAESLSGVITPYIPRKHRGCKWLGLQPLFQMNPICCFLGS